MSVVLEAAQANFVVLFLCLLRTFNNKVDSDINPFLWTCAVQLTGILHFIFNLSMKLERIPKLWKTSCIVPVPKKPIPNASTTLDQLL